MTPDLQSTIFSLNSVYLLTVGYLQRFSNTREKEKWSPLFVYHTKYKSAKNSLKLKVKNTQTKRFVRSNVVLMSKLQSLAQAIRHQPQLASNGRYFLLSTHPPALLFQKNHTHVKLVDTLLSMVGTVLLWLIINSSSGFSPSVNEPESICYLTQGTILEKTEVMIGVVISRFLCNFETTSPLTPLVWILSMHTYDLVTLAKASVFSVVICTQL